MILGDFKNTLWGVVLSDTADDINPAMARCILYYQSYQGSGRSGHAGFLSSTEALEQHLVPKPCQGARMKYQELPGALRLHHYC